METIREWLENGKDYNKGLALLAEFSKNRVLLQNLSRKNIPAKLEYELLKINKDATSGIIVLNPLNIIPETDVLKLNDKPKIDPEKLPGHLKILWEEIAEKYRLARAIHEQLKQMDDMNKRASHIELLESYRQEIRASWDVIDSWAKEPNAEVATSGIDEKRISANRKYLSDGKKSVAALNGAIRAKKLEAMQRRINELLAAGEKFDPENQKTLEELGMKFNG